MSAAHKLYSRCVFRPAKEPTHFVERGRSRQLVVLVHGFTGVPSSMRHVRSVIENAEPDADIFSPRFDAHVFSLIDPSSVARQLVEVIDDACAHRAKRGEEYRTIILLGHSCGALIARQAFLLARAAAGGGSVSGQWYRRVDRIVFLAGMNRGWSISHHQGRVTALLAGAASVIGNLIMTLARRRPLAFSIRRGSPFVTELRLAWHAAARDGGQPLPHTIQLLGTVDDLVSPQDNVDLFVDQRFTYLMVPRTGHSDVILMAVDSEERPNAGEVAVRQARAAVLRDAIMLSVAELRQRAVTLDTDSGIGGSEEAITDVVFVIHGIRDHGHWADKIAFEVQRIASEHCTEPRRFAKETASYGYFTMLPFLRPAERRAKVEWLMDRYAERRARHPAARFHFVGHSNGTYLLARALEDYPSCVFDSVVFAGSVVRSCYPWPRFLGTRVKRVMNYVATGDWVVAAFPNGLEQIGVQDLGAAGHRGFSSATNLAVAGAAPATHSPDGSLVEMRYVRGAHSAAIGEDHWPYIARFVVLGEVAEVLEPLYADRHDSRVSWLARGAWIIWLLLMAAALTLVVWLVSTIVNFGLAPYLPLLVAAFIWHVVTRV